MELTLAFINDFLTEAGVFSLATSDAQGNPHCRPIGYHLLRDDTLYFAVGTFKAVYRQLQENPRAEICAVDGAEFLRYFGEVKFEADDTLATEIVEHSPALQKVYNEETGHKLAVFHLEKATVELHRMSRLEECNKV